LVVASLASAAFGQIDFASLGAEMVDVRSVSRWPEHAYTTRQFSSYDRASTSPDAAGTWFANNDVNQFIRMEEVSVDGKTRKEWVMAEADGPGAIVRIWTPNPKGVLRVYVDGAPAPVIEGSMEKLLAGKSFVGEPLAQTQSRGWNLYLPIPYAKSVKVTTDQPGSYYHVNYRTYGAGVVVKSVTKDELAGAKSLIDGWNAALNAGTPVPAASSAGGTVLAKGASAELTASGEGAVTGFTVSVKSANMAGALRSLVVVGEFDGAQTIWCPLGDFFGTGVAPNHVKDWYRASGEGATFTARWVMPYKSAAKLRVMNLGDATAEVAAGWTTQAMKWDDRSMHFHAAWHGEMGIKTERAKGTRDWNYATIKGKGVLVGDNLSVFNPVALWWGEGDEKIYVDGEAFPSHFGTGTEDYYGYGWCDPTPFQHPFHGQAMCEGYKGKGASSNNRGHTFLSRVRSLDAIPFEKELRFDMEVWHWLACSVDYAATVYFYAMPGATTNREPQPEVAVVLPRVVPQPMKIAGAIECESLTPTWKSEGTGVVVQDLAGIGDGEWSHDLQLWVQGRAIGDFVELAIPASRSGQTRVILYATKSWDYGIVRFFVNGARAGTDIDMYSGETGRVIPTGPIDLGLHTPKAGKITLRAEVVGGNSNSTGSRSYFGLDCVELRSPTADETPKP
jgi:hypothetical protein